MAGEGTKRIVDLTEAAETQSGDYIAIDSTGRGTRKLPAGFMATAEDLSEEQTARQTADNALGDQITALDEKTEADAALIQNPTKTLSGALCSFTDGADMPMVACTAEIVPKQSGTGTPSPDNVRPISGWTEVKVIVSPTQEATDGTTTTTALGRTVYGGTLDVVSGSLTVDRAMVDLGTLNWSYSTDRVPRFGATFPSDVKYVSEFNAFNGVSSAYKVVPFASLYDPSTSVNGTMAAFSATRMAVRNDAYTDATSFKTAMNGVQLVYELVEPRTIQLTPKQVTTLLGENNVWADSGDVEITYRRDISIVINNLESALNG